jgi:lipopolysaccharide transport system ATP-binding protein
MSTVISVENLGKKYTISHQQRGDNSSLREVITNGAANFGKKLLSPLRRCSGQAFTLHPSQSSNHSSPSSLAPCPLTHAPGLEDFWALKDVSFEVKQGDRIGIIGKNGAGKSTLLKILSRITEPTTGKVKIKGRVASLLEVGTGFHPELTGRENIYLNGAILGMGRQEISRKFDEIVAFAEVERFLDTPVKRYSSGMYVRLAFAVAAHLEPEILIVDEVLAVGDASFQKKCLGKMEEVGREGRTVLFVSHNMAAIESLCTVTMIIAQGRNSFIGLTGEGIRAYLNKIANSATLPISARTDRTGKGNVLIRDIDLSRLGGASAYAIGDDISVTLLVENKYPHDVVARVAISIRNQNDVPLIVCDSIMTGEHCHLPAASLSKVTCKLFAPPLNYGEYLLNVAVFKDNEAEDWVLSAARLSIESGVFDDHIITLSFPVLARFKWSRELAA